VLRAPCAGSSPLGFWGLLHGFRWGFGFRTAQPPQPSPRPCRPPQTADIRPAHAPPPAEGTVEGGGELEVELTKLSSIANLFDGPRSSGSLAVRRTCLRSCCSSRLIRVVRSSERFCERARHGFACNARCRAGQLRRRAVAYGWAHRAATARAGRGPPSARPGVSSTCHHAWAGARGSRRGPLGRLRYPTQAATWYNQPAQVPRRSRSLVKAQATDDEDSVGVAGNAAIVGGLISNAVVAWSLVTLKNTGCGLPPGPGGAHPTPTLTPTCT